MILKRKSHIWLKQEHFTLVLSQSPPSLCFLDDTTDKQLLRKHIIRGLRPDLDKVATSVRRDASWEGIKGIMEECWSSAAVNRPEFKGDE